MITENKQQLVLQLFYRHANNYIQTVVPGMNWDSFPDLVSPWNEGLTENMTNAMIKVLAVRCVKKLIKKCNGGKWI